ncbi:MAG: tetratricopeptide repeat protein [Pelagibacteraceae bacterium]
MKTFLVIFLSLFLSFNAFSAGSDDDNTLVKPKDYKKAVKLIKNEKYSEAIALLEKILKKTKYQKDPDILNEYAFALRKFGVLDKAENYYKKALDIDANHRGALEYLGELYVDTKRIEKAKILLSKLENCKCEEYSELKSYINNSN